MIHFQKSRYIGRPRQFSNLPHETQSLCEAFTQELIISLHNVIRGIYLYGAVIFPESDYIVDFDSHVILNRILSNPEKNEIKNIHYRLVNRFQHLTEDDLDIWYILFSDRQQPAPSHQLNSRLSDTAWALHRAHMLAGYCIVLHGPKPNNIFSAPTWSELEIDLENEKKSIMKLVTKYPAYCILNACRLMYSFETKDVVVSKKAAAQWAKDRYHSWRDVINAAIRLYAKDLRDSDELLLETHAKPFLVFSQIQIENSRHK